MHLYSENIGKGGACVYVTITLDSGADLGLNFWVGTDDVEGVKNMHVVNMILE